MIDERQHRRPEFDEESVPVDFGPGKGTWYLPRPRLIYRRGRVDGKTVARLGRSFGAEYDQLIERLRLSQTLSEQIPIFFDIGSHLLLINYNLTEEDLDSILEFDPGPPGGEELPSPWDDIWEIARGLPPKSNAVGRSPASSPTASSPTA